MSAATIVVDLSFGDSGKGTVVDYLSSQYYRPITVVRYNGGAQAAHNVVLPDGRHHTFAQFGSGTFVPGCKTLLSRYMMVNPHNLFPEKEHLLKLGVDDIRLFVEDRALVTTPFHVAMNRHRERVRGDHAHGTTGQGVGETMSDSLHRPWLSLYVSDIARGGSFLRERLRDIQREKYREARELSARHAAPKILYDKEVIDDIERCYAEFRRCVEIVDEEWLEDRLAEPEGHVVFEGAQGVLLDEDFGFHPHTTWSKTTARNAHRLLNGRGAVTIGVIRPYMTRHGAGPLVTETTRSKLDGPGPERHNGDDVSAGVFRYGHLDLVALSYALDIQPIDEIAITHMDEVPGSWDVCVAYEHHERVGEVLPDLFETEPSNPHVITGLKPQETGSHTAMWAMTRVLLEARPIYESMSFEGALAKIGLSDKVSLLSHGPTRNDKTPITKGEPWDSTRHTIRGTDPTPPSAAGATS